MPVKGQFTIRLEEKGTDLNCRMVESSNILWVGWPTSGKPLLVVKFHSGLIYGYLGVSRQRAVAVAYAKSTGSYLNRVIKPQFSSVRLQGVQ